MTKEEIITGLQNWEDMRGDASKLIACFEQGNCFFYDIDEIHPLSKKNFHAYPALTNYGEFKFFMIPAEFDTPEHAEDYNLHVRECAVFWTIGSGKIDDKEAAERIERWKTFYKEWTHEQVNTEDGIFMAFQMRVADFESHDAQVTLGLRANGQQYNPYSADLIVVNKGLELISFNDFNNPVPPFDAAAASVDKFYLLSLVK
jgi:hypothetical protein